jgi:hypothetical protein
MGHLDREAREEANAIHRLVRLSSAAQDSRGLHVRYSSPPFYRQPRASATAVYRLRLLCSSTGPISPKA